MMLMSVLQPVIFIIIGKRFSKKAPENINYWLGYRTKKSMKNNETWKFAHTFIGKLWFIGGLVMLPLSVVPSFFVMKKSFDIIGITSAIIVGCQLFFIIISVICTEISLKKHFDNDGRPIL